MDASTPIASANIAPHLNAFALPFLGDTEATLRIMEGYCDLLEDRISHDLVRRIQNPVARGIHIYAHGYSAEELWMSMRTALSQLSPNIPQNALPSFEAIWEEAKDVLHHYYQRQPTSQDLHHIQDRLDFHGIVTTPLVPLVFEAMQTCPELHDSIIHIRDMQPRYTDIPNEAPDQSNARQLSDDNTLPEFVQAIGNFKHDADAILTFVGCFSHFLRTSMTLLLSRTNDDIVTEESLNASFHNAMDDHYALLCDPFSPTPLEHRQQLARINVRSTISLLTADALALLNTDSEPISQTNLPWHMFKKFVTGAMQAATAQDAECATNVRQALERYELSHFLDPNAQPIPSWSWIPEYDEDEEEADEEADLEHLDDVCFEPKGPELSVEHHAKTVTDESELPDEPCPICYDTLNAEGQVRDEIPVKTICGHYFHHACLNTLINGISKFSNSCPNCRETICPRRAKKLKGSKEVEEVGGTGGEETSNSDPAVCLENSVD